VFTVIVLFFAFTVSALIVGPFTTTMTRLLFLRSQDSAQFALLNNYLSDHQISPELQLRVQRNAHYSLNEQKRNTPETSVMLLHLVSDQLRAELHYEVHLHLLMVHPFFDLYNLVSPICIRMICHRAIDMLSLHSHDVLFSMFEASVKPKMFIVQTGTLQYSTSFGMCQKVTPKQWISEAVLWTHWIHRGTLKAKTESRILAIDSQQFGKLVSIYQTQEGHANKYAAKFVEALNETEICRISDIGNDSIVRERAEQAFLPDELARHSSRVRQSLRAFLGSGVPGSGGVPEGRTNRISSQRRSIASHVSS